MLIHGAGGNVGRYAVQLARHVGLEVLVTSSKSDIAWMTAQGAHPILDIGASGESVSAVIDLVGGESQLKLFGWLQPGGKLISAVNQPDVTLAAKMGITASFILVDVRTDALITLGGLFESGIIKPWIGEVLPLAKARTAHAMLAGTQAHKPGKIILCP